MDNIKFDPVAIKEAFQFINTQRAEAKQKRKKLLDLIKSLNALELKLNEQISAIERRPTCLN